MDNKSPKPNRIPLTDGQGKPSERISIGCSWGATVSKGGFLGLDRQVNDIDLDLSCVVFDNKGRLADAIVSPLYRPEFLARYGLPPGSVMTADSSIHLTSSSDRDSSSERLGRLVMTVDLEQLDPSVKSIFFILSNCGEEDFSKIPSTRCSVCNIREDGTPETITEMEIKGSGRLKGTRSVIIGKISRTDKLWSFKPMVEAFPDSNVGETVRRISLGYV